MTDEDLQTSKRLFEFVVLHEAWELDSKGWVVENDNGERAITLTNHGWKYFAERQELLDKIAEYQKVIADTEKALSLLGGKS